MKVQTKSSFKSLNLKQWIILFILITANIVIRMNFSCIAPFLVTVADSKGVTIIEDGIIFAVFDLLGFILSPFIGKMITILGLKTIFTSGLLFQTVGSLLFSLTDYINSGTWYFISTLILRIILSIGNAMVFTTTYAITARDFPYIMSTVLGILEASSGGGHTIGPTVGGFLYQYLGYQYPFLVLGLVCGLISLLSFFYISSDNDRKKSSVYMNNKPKNLTFCKIIKIKDVWCMLFTLSIIGFVISMHDATFAIGCQKFNLTSSQIGMLFLCLGGLYAIFSPILGSIVDRYSISGYFFISGYTLLTIAFSIMGPVPFFNYKPSIPLYALSLTLIGFGCSMLFVPAFKQCMDIVIKEHHYKDNLQTSSIISGFFSSAFSFGAFIGPLLGSMCVSIYGYRNTLSIMSLICFISTIFFITVYTIPRMIKIYNNNNN